MNYYILLFFIAFSFSSDSFNLDEIKDYQYERITKINKLPSFIRSEINFKNEFCIKSPLRKKIFDEIYYKFKFAAANNKFCLVFYEHKGRGNHFHCSVFKIETEEMITINLLNDITSIDGLLSQVIKYKSNLSQCNLEN